MSKSSKKTMQPKKKVAHQQETSDSERAWQEQPVQSERIAKPDTATDDPAQTHPLQEEINTLTGRIQVLEAQLKTQQDQLLRTQAESINAHNRAQKDISSARKYALQESFTALLQVFDSLEHGLNNSIDSDDPVLQKIHQGNELTLQMFLKITHKFGLEPINPLGEPFNPDRHEAISTQEDEVAKTHTILKVLQKGYLLNGRLIRPARVIVAGTVEPKKSS